MKKILGCLLLGMLVLFSAEKVALAEQPDFDRKGSINIYMRTTDGDLVKGGSLEAYKVASVSTSSQGYKYVYTSDFDGSGYSLDEKDVGALALKLYDYAVGNDVHGDLYENKTGIVKIDNLASGLYLIDNKKPPEGYDGIVPFLVSVPFQQDSTWIYDVDASPKMGLLSLKSSLPPMPQPEPPEPEPELKPESNSTKDALSPKTGDESGDIVTIIISFALICTVQVFIGAYYIAKGRSNNDCHT